MVATRAKLAVDQFAQDLEVDPLQAGDVDAASAGAMRPEPVEDVGVGLGRACHQVERDVPLLRREPDAHPVALAARGVAVVVLPEPDDLLAPHHGLLSRDLGQ